MRKRGIVLFLALALIAVSLVACSGLGQGLGAKKPVTINLLTPTDWYNDTWKRLLGEYEKQTGNKLEIQTIPGGDQFEQLVLTRIGTKDFPDIMFYYTSEGSMRKLNPEQNLYDISKEEYLTRVKPVIKKYFLKFNSKFYSIPIDGLNLSGVLYNKKVFEDIGLSIPKTYEEFLDVCGKIKAAGITPIYDAGKDAWTLQLYTLSGFSNIFKKDPEVINKMNKHEVTFDTLPGYISLLEKQLELKEKGYFNQDLFSATYDMQLEQVATGKSAMIFQGDWVIPELLKRFPGAPIGMFPQPTESDNYVAFPGPPGVYVFKNSKVLNAAKELMTYMAKPEVLQSFYEERKSISAWQGVNVNLNPGTKDLLPYFDESKAAPFFDGVIAAPFSPYPPELQEMLAGKKTPTEVAKAIQANFDKEAKTAGLQGW